MSEESVTLLDEFEAPYGRRVRLENVQHESGMRMLRVRIREGSRFTIMDLDERTARLWGAAMSSWADDPGCSA